MGTFRLYTGPDGQSRVEPIDLAKTPEWTKGLATAPRRQFVIILSGRLEIGLGDGGKHVFGPGDARLVEDTTGKGHTTRVHGTERCVTATIPLAEQ